MFYTVTKFLLYLLCEFLMDWNLVAAGSCPHGWDFFDSSCYIAYEDTMTFNGASQLCKDNGGYLVEISSSYENVFVHNIQKTIRFALYVDGPRCVYVGSPIWIGMTDVITDGNFTWYESGDKVVYTNWAPGEPNKRTSQIEDLYPDSGEECVEMDYDKGQWNDIQCSLVRLPFCERNCLE